MRQMNCSSPEQDRKQEGKLETKCFGLSKRCLVAWSRMLEKIDDSGHLLETELTGTGGKVTGCREPEKVRNQGCFLGFWHQLLRR